jgi:predicted RNase H-like HicB family nuclease
MRFSVVLHTDDGVRFGVTVPDLPGCFSSGDTFDEALDFALEAIDLHLEGIIEDGGEIPLLKTIAEHRANPDFADGVWAIVDVPVERYFDSTETIKITLPRLLIAKMDDYIQAHGITRSSFFADLVRSTVR